MDLSIIQKKIFEIHGQRVMLDKHLAELYGVETKVLVQGMKRNINRFPSDFMFQLNQSEWEHLRSQFVTSSWGGSRYLPYAFTEHGITMLSSVLRSDTAVAVNISVVRAFILLKQYGNDFQVLQQQINALESKFNRKIENINDFIELIMNKPEVELRPQSERNRIGYKLPKKTQ